MANTKISVERIEFIIQDDMTICNLFYSSDEPGNPFWGGGWKTKSFSAKISIVDFMNKDVSDYIMWPSGREGVEAYNEA